MGQRGSKAADWMQQQYDNDDAFTPRNDHGIGDDFQQEKYAIALQNQGHIPGSTILNLGPVKRNLRYYDSPTQFSTANRFVVGGRMQIMPTPGDYPEYMPSPRAIHNSVPLDDEHVAAHADLLKVSGMTEEYYNSHPDARI